MFDNVLLEPDQQQLLTILVEAARNVARERQQKFGVLRGGMDSFLHHPGLRENIPVYMGDVEALAAEGLLHLRSGSGGTPFFDVTPRGFAFYSYLKQRSGAPTQRVEKEIRQYLESDAFSKTYGEAYRKWTEAEALLWGEDPDSQLTNIGHLCREALQEFVTTLASRVGPPDLDPDKAHTVNRLKTIMDFKAPQLGTTVKPFLDALLAYWKASSDLVQRQAHGGQKEGEPLRCEDGRRVVFQTTILMFEVDRGIV